MIPTRTALIGLMTLCATSVYAQEPNRHAHRGFWIAVGWGVAHNNLECTGCTFLDADDPWRGGTGIGAAYAVGGAVNQQLLLGAELNPSGTARLEGGETESASIFLLLFVVQHYPSPTKGFHIKGGVGPALYILERPGASVNAGGWAIRGEVGYDFRLKGSFSLTPHTSLTLTTSQPSTIETSGSSGTVTDLTNRFIFQTGLSLRWY